jgi:hypothetical protein
MVKLTCQSSDKAYRWAFSESQQANLVRKTCLSQCLHGQQQEHATTHDNIDIGDLESDSATDDGRMITEPGLPGLKRRVLERFTEIMARKKDPRFISSTAMDECERPEAEDYMDKAVIYILRNAFVDSKDKKFLACFKNCLEAVSRQGMDNGGAAVLSADAVLQSPLSEMRSQTCGILCSPFIKIEYNFTLFSLQTLSTRTY